MKTHGKALDAPAALSPEQQSKVREALERVLSSPAFRNSKQCQKFLRFVVEHSNPGEEEILKERNIGIEVFGREPDYDTSDDPIVRVRATEVRKRLSQYYGDATDHDEVRFEIPSGSYRAETHWLGTGTAPSAGQARPVTPQWLARRRVAALAFVGLAILAGLLVLMYRKPPVSTLDQFWEPVLNSPKPVLVYCGQPVVYFLSGEVHRKFRGTIPAEKQQRGSYAVELAPDETIRGKDIIPVTDQFVGIGNAHTAALLSSLFATHHKAVEIRYANDLSFSDLRSSPSVLVGAFSNLWTLEMTGQLRYVFEQAEGIRRIRDRTGNKTWDLPQIAPDGKTPEDYAIVTRLFDSATGQLLISAAGITQYGTRAAGEFLTDDGRLKDALAKVPDWPKKNLQVLLHTTVYKGTPAAPSTLAAHVW